MTGVILDPAPRDLERRQLDAERPHTTDAMKVVVPVASRTTHGPVRQRLPDFQPFETPRNPCGLGAGAH